MRETVPSYVNLVHWVKEQIAADKAIEAHRQQFEGFSKQKIEAEPALPTHRRNDDKCDNPAGIKDLVGTGSSPA
ncbi:hypothetical protein KSP40_PGU011768 [Platanthera guangdongensis]|uniref:Uncharacterized protein n=1 Tax=Platanthera guangdongensis TaxID=2320717 RepID=A0ABR2LVE1_9ASPA